MRRLITRRDALTRLLAGTPAALGLAACEDLRAAGKPAATKAAPEETPTMPACPLGRGINLGNMLEAPREGDWGERLDEGHFAIIAAAGFANVRLPIRWSSHAGEAAPYTIDAEFIARVDRAVAAARAAKLRVVLNIHHYEEIFREPRDHQERFLALWEQIAEHYADADAEVWFELLNEPHAALDAAVWNPMAAAATAVVRRSNADRTIVIGPPNWNAVNALEHLDLPADEHLCATFHYYLPFEFTHQGAEWTGPMARQWLGTEWHGTPAEQEAVRRDFDGAVAWAAERRVPLYLGEFGAYSRADLASRERWTRCVADAAIERAMGFAYWEFCAGFGAWDKQAAAWRDGLKRALLGE